MYELDGMLAKYFGGALPFSEIEKHGRRWKMHYYRIMERQQAETEIADSFRFPSDGSKPKDLPSPKRMRVLVDKKIAEWKKESGA